ncbi:MAG: cyclic nucleotide-binding domain-containing protein [Rhodospirillales bacterium]|nr:cyclic nucleotide-binding domain-containing protein [Alphaproteobacteria bacterium]USO03491.1 MAG: cyclic nucleotide-binding domain-containing protein [Rhodospirillales bacterium]
MARRRETVILERRFVPEGAVVIEEGTFGAQAFLIQSGSVRVYTSHEGREVELSRLGIGEIIGEMALIFDGPRTASVQALEDCNLIVIGRQQFMDKLKDTDSTIRAVVHMMTKRMVDVNNSLVSKKSNMDDLKDTARVIYQNISGALPQKQQALFQNTVLPPLEEFLAAIEDFQERYGPEDGKS